MSSQTRLQQLWFGKVGPVVFVSYAIVLAVLTHWPDLTIDGPVPRPDLWIHAGAFGLWSLLLAASGLVGRRLGVVLAVRVSIIGVLWAGIDEWTQQFVGRTTAWDDFLANCVGVALAAGAILSVAWMSSRRPKAR